MKIEHCIAETERYRQLLESSPVIPWELDLETFCYTYVGPQAEKILGHRREAWYRPGFWHEHVHPEDRDETIACCTTGTAQGRERVLDYRMLTADGSERWMRDMITVHWQGEQPVKLRGLMIDVTERKRQQQALLMSEARYRLIAENGADALWDWDIAGGSFHWSERLFRILGHEPDALTPSRELVLERIHPEDRPRLEEVVLRYLTAQHPDRIELRMRRQDHTYVWVGIKGTAIFNRFGKPVRAVGILDDLTEQRRAAENLRQNREQLQHAQKLKSLGVLAGGIAHHFNNLLLALLGHADLALGEMESSTGRESLQEIIRTGQRATELCKQMLDYAGRGHLAFRQLDAATQVREVKHLLEVAAARNATIRYDIANKLPLFEGDAAQINQIIMNLVTNAAEALGDRGGWITLRIDSRKCDAMYLAETYLATGLHPGTYVLIEVQDTGCGLSEEARERLFDPFFTTKRTGRGLGLAAVLGIVRAHHGGIRLDSQPGRGTTVTVLFPATTQPIATVPPAVAGPEKAEKERSTILFVDDEDVIRRMGKQMLERFGYEALVACDGVEALEIFAAAAERIDLVILDVSMPRLSGRATFDKMVAIDADVRVILTSGYDERGAWRTDGGQRPVSFLQKPYNARKLRDLLRHVLAERKSDDHSTPRASRSTTLPAGHVAPCDPPAARRAI